VIDERTITEAQPGDLPSILGELARLTAIATLRLTAPTVAAVEPEPDRLLTAEQAALLCGLSVEALKRRRDLPFRRKLGPKTIRFSARGIERHLKRSA